MAIQIKKTDTAPVPLAKASELALTVTKFHKELGAKSIVRGADIPQCKRLPTGVFEFDLATGGGFPCSRYSILYGPESSCKTNLVYKAIASAQRLPPPCNKAVLVDVEGTFDPAFAMKFGVDVDALLVAKPSYGEQAVDMVDALVRADDVAFLGLDSLAALIGIREVEGSTEKVDVGTSSLLIKRLCIKLATALSEEQKRDHTPCVVFINQTRSKIGVMFGNPEVMPGGQTMKFMASLIVRLSGKNLMVKEISGAIPVLKTVSAVIRKAKIGVVQESFEFDMCMVEHGGLMVGETDSFTKVKGYLQSSGHLIKSDKGGWALFGKNYATLVTIQDTYKAEDAFAQKLQQQVIKNHSLLMVSEKPLEDKTDGGSK